MGRIRVSQERVLLKRTGRQTHTQAHALTISKAVIVMNLNSPNCRSTGAHRTAAVAAAVFTPAVSHHHLQQQCPQFSVCLSCLTSLQPNYVKQMVKKDTVFKFEFTLTDERLLWMDGKWKKGEIVEQKISGLRYEFNRSTHALCLRRLMSVAFFCL